MKFNVKKFRFDAKASWEENFHSLENHHTAECEALYKTIEDLEQQLKDQYDMIYESVLGEEEV